jgi:hypothetical protein
MQLEFCIENLYYSCLRLPGKASLSPTYRAAKQSHHIISVYMLTGRLNHILVALLYLSINQICFPKEARIVLISTSASRIEAVGLAFWTLEQG